MILSDTAQKALLTGLTCLIAAGGAVAGFVAGDVPGAIGGGLVTGLGGAFGCLLAYRDRRGGRFGTADDSAAVRMQLPELYRRRLAAGWLVLVLLGSALALALWASGQGKLAVVEASAVGALIAAFGILVLTLRRNARKGS